MGVGKIFFVGGSVWEKRECGCQSDGLEEADMMRREGRREGGEEGGREGSVHSHTARTIGLLSSIYTHSPSLSLSPSLPPSLP